MSTLIDLTQRIANDIIQLVAEVLLTDVAPLEAVNHRCNLNLISIRRVINVFRNSLCCMAV